MASEKKSPPSRVAPIPAKFDRSVGEPFLVLRKIKI